MQSRWLRVPEVETDGRIQPKYAEHFASFTGFRVGDAPFYVVRAYGSSGALDTVASETDVQALDESGALNQLNSIRDGSFDGAALRRSFRVETE